RRAEPDRPGHARGGAPPGRRAMSASGTSAAPPPEDEQRAPDGASSSPRGGTGRSLLRAVAVMEALRTEDASGDAWSALQTHQSLARYLLEESHEVIEVIEDPAGHAPGAIVDELGDLLFQILFHARIGQEEDPSWSIDDVAEAFVAKMERRNPHVFGPGAGEALAGRDDVEAIIAQWHAVKAQEAGERGEASSGPSAASPFASIPARLPALQTAAKAVHRARSAGALDGLLETADAIVAAQDAPEGADIGRALLTEVVGAEARDVDPESALRALLARISRELPASP
ncbi:MazG nucleotide pyrophosphohydrolase domain-containing protein, partial [Brachybacterium hainanense]